MFNSPSMIIDSFRPHTGSGSYFYFQDPSSNECYRLKIETEYPNDGIFGLETVSLNNVLFDGIVFDLASSLKEHAKYYVFIQECEHIHHEAVSRPIAALDHHEFVSRQITARQIAARHMSGTYHNSLVYQIGQEMPNGQAIRTFNYLTRLNDSRSSTIVKSYAALLVPEQDLTLLISKIDETKNKAALPKEPSPSGIVEGISAFDKKTRSTSKLRASAATFKPKSNNPMTQKKPSPHYP